MEKIKQELLTQVLNLLISDLDVVNNQEFEIQKKVLKRTREKIEKIEKKLTLIEKEILTKLS